MDLLVVSALILLGLLLVIAEIIFVPGTTVVGVIGAGFMIAGIVSSFSYLGQQGGWITVGVTGLSSILIFYYAFKANVWGRFSLKTSSQGKVNEGGLDGLSAGQEGKAISALRPSGKAEISDKTYEVKTLGDFVASGSKVRIIKVTSNQIIVEPIQ